MSNKASTVFIVEPDAQMRDLLARALNDHNINGIDVVQSSSDAEGKSITFNDDQSGTYTIQKPYYLGALLNAIKRLQDHNATDEIIVLGRYTLDIVQNSISTPHGDKAVKLTEKERDILLLLNSRAPENVSKDVLLDQVWGYGAQIETHTLETHIYRLRQKIEKDSSNPDFLITSDKGYTLAI